METRKIVLFDRPEPRHFFLYVFLIGAGCYFTYSIAPALQALLRTASLTNVLYLLAMLFLGPIFLFFGLTGWFPRRIVVTKDSIRFGGGVANFAKSKPTAKGQTELPISDSYRLHAKKEGFTKGISFSLHIPAEEGKWIEYQLLSHCSRPRKVAKKLNDVFQALGHKPLDLDLSGGLEKKLQH